MADVEIIVAPEWWAIKSGCMPYLSTKIITFLRTVSKSIPPKIPFSSLINKVDPAEYAAIDLVATLLRG